MTALHLAGAHAMMVDITMDLQACDLIARCSPDRSRGDYPSDHHRRDTENKERLIFNGRDNVNDTENTLTELAAVAEFARARLRKAKLPSCMRRFSVQISQLRSGMISALREASQTENVSSAKNGERHAS
jgi:hypothetical protein